MSIPQNHARNSNDRLSAVIVTQTEIASAGLDLGRVMQVIVEHAQNLTGASGAVVELAEGDDMVYRAACGGVAQFLGLRLARVGSLSGLCVEQGEPLKCDDTQTDPRVNKEACEKISVRSMIVVPLHHFDKVVGVLKVMSGKPNHFDDLDVQTLRLITGLTAAAMSHATEFETRKEQLDALFHKATHDPLTGLANRALFLDRLRHELTIERREKRGLAVLLLDMDNMKVINDSLGHHAGDAALKEVARRATSALREVDTLARLGGDEFAAILSGIHDRAGVDATIHRINATFSSPLMFEGRALDIGVSIGAAISPENGEDSDSLMHAADLAMYKVKKERRAGRK
jgi:diguanylate cyclase (GGDEF)-like protein